MNKILPWVCWDHPYANVVKSSFDGTKAKTKNTCGMCGRKLRSGAEAKK